LHRGRLRRSPREHRRTQVTDVVSVRGIGEGVVGLAHSKTDVIGRSFGYFDRSQVATCKRMLASLRLEEGEMVVEGQEVKSHMDRRRGC